MTVFNWKVSISNAVKAGKNVEMKVEVGYANGTNRPNRFLVTAKINGSTKTFPFTQ
ncbi:hypothetical protein [Acinetobacter sp. 3657]|uniref:hypothetical protein n=1 Tax=Acinetobacter sp. 3657 TaxID=2817764 RepID=UPI00285781D8|nr:hypothetical protein [Prolinoborus sp. 3657]